MNNNFGIFQCFLKLFDIENIIRNKFALPLWNFVGSFLLIAIVS